MRAPAPDPEVAAAVAASLGALPNLNATAQQIHRVMRSIDAARSLGAEARPIIAGSPGLLSASIGRLAGVNFHETSGAASVVRLFDGIDPSGTLLLALTVPANGAVSPWFLPGGISFGRGLFLTVSAGVIEGAAYLGTTLGPGSTP